MLTPEILLRPAGSALLNNVITAVGLRTNLKLCLDSGDAASYTSGQSWLDRSGNGYDFFLGVSGSATATDPTFSGTPGSPQAYWTFDGGDFFRYDSVIETWMNNLHKNNAAFTILAFFYKDGSDERMCFGGTGARDTFNFTGIDFFDEVGLMIQVGDSTVTTVLSAMADNQVPAASWHGVAVSLNEATGAGGGFFWRDGGYEQVAAANTWDSTYVTPTAGSASFTMEIAAFGDAVQPTHAGQRLACVAMWDVALTKAQLDSIWVRMRGRFGI